MATFNLFRIVILLASVVAIFLLLTLNSSEESVPKSRRTAIPTTSTSAAPISDFYNGQQCPTQNIQLPNQDTVIAVGSTYRIFWVQEIYSNSGIGPISVSLTLRPHSRSPPDRMSPLICWRWMERWWRREFPSNQICQPKVWVNSKLEITRTSTTTTTGKFPQRLFRRRTVTLLQSLSTLGPASCSFSAKCPRHFRS